MRRWILAVLLGSLALAQDQSQASPPVQKKQAELERVQTSVPQTSHVCAIPLLNVLKATPSKPDPMVVLPPASDHKSAAENITPRAPSCDDIKR